MCSGWPFPVQIGITAEASEMCEHTSGFISIQRQKQLLLPTSALGWSALERVTSHSHHIRKQKVLSERSIVINNPRVLMNQGSFVGCGKIHTT